MMLLNSILPAKSSWKSYQQCMTQPILPWHPRILLVLPSNSWNCYNSLSLSIYILAFFSQVHMRLLLKTSHAWVVSFSPTSHAHRFTHVTMDSGIIEFDCFFFFLSPGESGGVCWNNRAKETLWSGRVWLITSVNTKGTEFGFGWRWWETVWSKSSFISLQSVLMNETLM